MRNPDDPVSTSMSLTVVQLEVPVAHTVIEAKPSSAVSNGPAVIENGNALAVLGAAVEVGVAVGVRVGVGPVAVAVGTGPFALPLRAISTMLSAAVLQFLH